MRLHSFRSPGISRGEGGTMRNGKRCSLAQQGQPHRFHVRRAPAARLNASMNDACPPRACMRPPHSITLTTLSAGQQGQQAGCSEKTDAVRQRPGGIMNRAIWSASLPLVLLAVGLPSRATAQAVPTTVKCMDGTSVTAMGSDTCVSTGRSRNGIQPGGWIRIVAGVAWSHRPGHLQGWRSTLPAPVRARSTVAWALRRRRMLFTLMTRPSPFRRQPYPSRS